MKKLMQSLLVLLLALSLVACSNTTDVEPTPTSTTETEEIDTNVYVPVGTKELDLTQLVLPLDDYTYKTVSINEEKSDYDLSTKGEYNLTLDLKDENDELIEEVETVLVVEDEEVVKEKVEAQKNQRNAKVDVEDKDLVAKPSEDGKTTVTDNPEKTESNKTPSNTTASNNNQSSNSSSSSTSGSSSDWNGGLNTDPAVYGLDENNEAVQAAFSLIGKEGLCRDIVNDFYTLMGQIGTPQYECRGTDWNSVTEDIRIGDHIWYSGLNGTSTNHSSIYLGNGLALHGNWTGGVARIANAYQPANEYSVMSRSSDKTCSSGCTDCSVGGSNPEREEEYKAEKEEVANTITEEYCRVTLVYDLSTAEFAVCEELYGSDVFNWG